MEAESSRFELFTRRARSGAVAVAIAGLSAGFAACGDDETQKSIDDAKEEIDKAQEEIDKEAEKAGGDVEEAVDEIQKEADEIQSDVDKEIGEN